MKAFLSGKEIAEKFDFARWKKMLTNVDRAIDNISNSKNTTEDLKKELRYIFGVFVQYFKEIRTGLEHRPYYEEGNERTKYCPLVLSAFHDEWIKPFYLSIDLISIEEAKKSFREILNIRNFEKFVEFKKRIQKIQDLYGRLHGIFLETRNFLKNEETFDIIEIYENVSEALELINERVGERILPERSLLRKEHEIYLKIKEKIKPLAIRKYNFEKVYHESFEILRRAETLLQNDFPAENKIHYMQQIKMCRSVFRNIMRLSNIEDILLTGNHEQNDNMINLVKMHFEIILDVFSKINREYKDKNDNENWRIFEKQFSECSLQQDVVVVPQYRMNSKKENKSKYLEDLMTRIFKASDSVCLEELKGLLDALKNNDIEKLEPSKKYNMPPLQKEYIDRFAYFLNMLNFTMSQEEVKICRLSH